MRALIWRLLVRRCLHVQLSDRMLGSHHEHASWSRADQVREAQEYAQAAKVV